MKINDDYPWVEKIYCPYCWFRFEDTMDYFDIEKDTGSLVCPKCKKEFDWEMEVTHYCTKKENEK